MSAPVPTPSASTGCISDARLICITNADEGVPVVIIFVMVALIVLLMTGFKRRNR